MFTYLRCNLFTNETHEACVLEAPAGVSVVLLRCRKADCWACEHHLRVQLATPQVVACYFLSPCFCFVPQAPLLRFHRPSALVGRHSCQRCWGCPLPYSSGHDREVSLPDRMVMLRTRSRGASECPSTSDPRQHHTPNAPDYINQPTNQDVAALFALLMFVLQGACNRCGYQRRGLGQYHWTTAHATPLLPHQPGFTPMLQCYLLIADPCMSHGGVCIAVKVQEPCSAATSGDVCSLPLPALLVTVLVHALQPCCPGAGECSPLSGV
jgi:hypothetical protein